MALFSYKAIDRDGALIRGVIEETDVAAATDIVSATGLDIITIRESSELVNSLRKTFTMGKRIEIGDIIEFANNLSIMLRSGVPILTALNGIAESTEVKFFRDKIKDMALRLERGSGFSSAVAAHSDIFPDIFRYLVVVGEETGNLDRSLDDVAAHLQKMEDLRSSIKGALIYPIFAMVTTFGALMFWMLYVLPKIMQMFETMDVELPAITRGLLYTSSFIQAHKYLVFSMPFLIFFSIKIIGKFEKGRYYIDLAKLKLPIVKLVVYNKLLALYAEQMRILTVAGITIERSLSIISNVIGNAVFRQAIDKEKEDITAGSRISDAMKKHWIFPPLVIRMIDVGEVSGNLDEQYGYLSEYYLKKLDTVADRMSKMIEPIVIGVVGFLFGIIIVGLMLPIYDLISKIQ